MTNSKYVTKVLFDHKQLKSRIKELADWINQHYTDQDELVIIGILKGAFPFLAELIKNVTVVHEIDFMMISSYEGTKKSTGKFKVVMDLDSDITGKNVLIVEDIIDTGLVIKTLKNMLLLRRPAEIKVMTLLSKVKMHERKYEADITGFSIGNDFIIGFGFDYKQKYRNLTYIGVFDENFS